jgi:cyclophilin family peptidyl-prolyl cis-trans isomerase
VITGMDVVDAIAKVQKDANDRPLTEVKIIEATIIP